MLTERGHMGGSSTIGNDLKEIDSNELDNLEKILNDMPNYLIVANETDIPIKFKKWRTYRNYTLRDVEEITGISNAYLSILESGKIKKPSFEVVAKLCKVYFVRLVVSPL